jgi:hypothetical protein
MIKAARPNESNLVRTLVLFSRWRSCSSCGELVLFVGEHCETSTDFACGRCHHRVAIALAANHSGESMARTDSILGQAKTSHAAAHALAGSCKVAKDVGPTSSWTWRPAKLTTCSSTYDG